MVLWRRGLLSERVVVEGTIFLSGELKKGAFAFEDGVFVELGAVGELKGDVKLDFGSSVILPAGIDIHVHFREPGFVEKEDFFSGSVAALYGGISCVFDMPNTKPAGVSVAHLEAKRELAESKSVVDFGLYAGLMEGNLSRAQALSSVCDGFKVFLGSSTGSLLLDMAHLSSVFEAVSGLGSPVMFHAESEGFLQRFCREEKDLLDHLAARPSVCEVSAIDQVCAAAEGCDIHAHICHVSSAEGLQSLSRRPKNVSCGVTPHHVLLNPEGGFSCPGFGKVNPPLRLLYDRTSLLQGLVSGEIDVFESDHAPHLFEEKCIEIFDEVPCGMPGVETLYPLLLWQVREGRLSLARAIELVCDSPARLFGLKKGRLEVGFDADFIVVDMDRPVCIDGSSLHSRCGWSAFDGWYGLFASDVFVRGAHLLVDGQMQAKKGCGRWVGLGR